ncbi:hypothetical protein CTU88_32440 [Streptomyces sp. JV178]|nr:hypothetical protein CTU88_32440 [Streptomyces sp. JV178]
MSGGTEGSVLDVVSVSGGLQLLLRPGRKTVARADPGDQGAVEELTEREVLVGVTRATRFLFASSFADGRVGYRPIDVSH